MTCGDAWRTTRSGRLLATTLVFSAIATEKLGCERPDCKKYLTRRPSLPIAVEIKMVPGHTGLCRRRVRHLDDVVRGQLDHACFR
jgi:hypothetical protein